MLSPGFVVQSSLDFNMNGNRVGSTIESKFEYRRLTIRTTAESITHSTNVALSMPRLTPQESPYHII